MVRTVSDVSSHELETVSRDTDLVTTLEKMFENDFTQLGIEQEGEVVGMVSFRSISRVVSIMRRLGVDKKLPGRTVELAIEDPDPVVTPDKDLVVLFDLLAEDPYVLVDTQEGLEILTNYDLLQYLHAAIEPFLLIEDIERSIRELVRTCLGSNISKNLKSIFSDLEVRTPDNLEDCSFGHYPTLFRQNWDAFDEVFEENGDFVGKLMNEVRDVRNDVFHFRREPHDPNIDYSLLLFAHGYFSQNSLDH
jgi:CBS domain-containing protein